MSATTPPNAEDLTETIFAYVNGSLSVEARIRFEMLLDSDPAVRAELSDWQDLRRELDVRRQERAPEAGLERITRHMRAGRPQREAGFAELLERWMRNLYSPPRFAAALALVVVQAGSLVALLSNPRTEDLGVDPSTTQVRSISGSSKATLRVRFRPDATAREIAATLSGAGAQIADGPGQAGFYSLRVPEDSRSVAIAALRQSKVIDEVIEGAIAKTPEPDKSPGR